MAAQRDQPRSNRTARVWTAIIAVVALALGGYWTVRGVEHAKVVDRGRGRLTHPFVHCTRARNIVCTRNVHLLISATGENVTLEDVNGLYAMLSSRPAHQMPVEHVYYDTTNSEVNRVVYGGTTYGVETTKHAFRVLGIVLLVIGLAALGLYRHLARPRRPGTSSSGELPA